MPATGQTEGVSFREGARTGKPAVTAVTRDNGRNVAGVGGGGSHGAVTAVTAAVGVVAEAVSSSESPSRVRVCKEPGSAASPFEPWPGRSKVDIINLI